MLIQFDPAAPPSKTPYENLYLAVLAQAIYDYALAYRFIQRNPTPTLQEDINLKENYTMLMNDIVKWVKRGKGTFEMCAIAWDKSVDELQKLVLAKFKDIDNGQPLKTTSPKYTH